MSDLVKSRGPQEIPKISTREIIREVSEHTNAPYDIVADVVYAYLHYIKYAALSTDEKLVMRNFGSFYKSTTKGRVYGAHVGAKTFHPDRIKLGISSPLIERDQWTNTLSIQKSVIAVLDAALKPSSMDLSVCARIADLVLSNKPLPSLKGEDKIEFIRQWVYATGAAPLLPAVSKRSDRQEREYAILKFRLRGEDRQAFVFDFDFDDRLFATFISKHSSDLFFLPTWWTSAGPLRAITEEPLQQNPFGIGPEAHCSALYLAYKATKYGKDKVTQKLRRT